MWGSLMLKISNKNRLEIIKNGVHELLTQRGAWLA